MDIYLQKKLSEYAKERADKVESIDIDELRQLIVDGAKWMHNEINLKNV